MHHLILVFGIFITKSQSSTLGVSAIFDIDIYIRTLPSRCLVKVVVAAQNENISSLEQNQIPIVLLKDPIKDPDQSEYELGKRFENFPNYSSDFLRFECTFNLIFLDSHIFPRIIKQKHPNFQEYWIKSIFAVKTVPNSYFLVVFSGSTEQFKPDHIKLQPFIQKGIIVFTNDLNIRYQCISSPYDSEFSDKDLTKHSIISLMDTCVININHICIRWELSICLPDLEDDRYLQLVVARDIISLANSTLIQEIEKVNLTYFPAISLQWGLTDIYTNRNLHNSNVYMLRSTTAEFPHVRFSL